MTGDERERVLRHVAARSAGPPVEASLQITFNIHPDRLVGSRPILRALGADGVCLSQFVTGTSKEG